MAVTVSFYNNFVEDVGRGRINMASDTFKIALVNSYTFDATDADYAALSGQLSTSHGYTSPGATLASVTWAFGSGVTKWDAADVTWSASGGSIGPATGAVIYSDTSSSPTNDRLVLYIDFGASQTAGDGTDFKITFNASGIFTIS